MAGMAHIHRVFGPLSQADRGRDPVRGWANTREEDRMSEGWKDVTSDEIQQVIDHLETMNCVASAKVRLGLFDVLEEKLKEEAKLEE
jgi:hypothetical protein